MIGPKGGGDRGPDAAASVALLYERLHLNVPPGKREVTTRALHAGAPLSIGALSHILELDAYVSWWVSVAEQILDPKPIFTLPWPCPYCDARLTVYVAEELITCAGVDPADPDEAPHQWEGVGAFRRLATLLASEHDDVRPEAAQRIDRRRGARPNWDALTEAVG